MKKTIVINGIKYLKSECTYIFGFLIKKGAPFNGIEHENYHNNQLKSEINYKDGKKHGLCKFWYDNGQLKSEINFKEDKPDGLYKDYYTNGQLKSESFFEIRLKKYKEWDQIGLLKIEENYSYDKQGTLKEEKLYYENGQLKSIKQWKNRFHHSRWIYWSEDGKITSEVNFFEGENDGPQREYWNNGQLKLERIWKPNGGLGADIIISQKYWHKNGKKIKKDEMNLSNWSSKEFREWRRLK